MTPMVMKSRGVQTTSLVNFIATNGMTKSAGTARRMRMNRMFFMTGFELINWTRLAAIAASDHGSENNVQQAKACGHHRVADACGQ